MKLNSLWSLSAIVLLGGVALATVCVSDGSSGTVTFTQPALPSGDTWEPTTPEMMEDDVVSDDSMGPATSTGSGTATGTVTNSGGDLFGPRGGDQNGGTEGDCIEVKMCWKYKHWVPAHTYVIEGYSFTIPALWEISQICSAIEDVCPSGSGGCP